MSLDFFLHKYHKKFKHYENNSWGLLCNQTSWSFCENQYLFEILNQKKLLKRVFLPEHGLFAELQDQIALDNGNIYHSLVSEPEFVSLYGSNEDSLLADPAKLNDLQVLVVDIQDVGSRYYTFATTLGYLFKQISATNLDIEIIIIDRPNPAGRQVEGSVLPGEFESFVGFPGLPHRHGLSIGELAHYYKDFYDTKCKMDIVFNPEDPFFNLDISSEVQNQSFQICPSPNMPNRTTAMVYSGQCLLEGTSLSEGRGTTRPFEIFGAPGIHNAGVLKNVPQAIGASLRPLRFIPVFHKHANIVCDGWQIHLTGEQHYHSLKHSLQLIRYIKENYSDFLWRSDEYEFRSDRPAIEILVADEILLDYLNGKTGFSIIEEYLLEAESNWIHQSRNWKIHNPKLYSVIN